MSEDLRVWLAPEDLDRENNPSDQLETAVRLSDRQLRGRREIQGRLFDKLLLVLSEHSIKTEWVPFAIRNAAKAKRETGKLKLFAIRLASIETIRPCSCLDSEAKNEPAIHEDDIADFSDWKNQTSFESAFKRLLADLKGDDTTAH